MILFRILRGTNRSSINQWPCFEGERLRQSRHARRGGSEAEEGESSGITLLLHGAQAHKAEAPEQPGI
eukprot:6087105-Pyramimonas_sp.AAC.1